MWRRESDDTCNLAPEWFQWTGREGERESERERERFEKKVGLKKVHGVIELKLFFGTYLRFAALYLFIFIFFLAYARFKSNLSLFYKV